MRIAIVTRCDVPFRLDSAHADWSSDYQVARLLAVRGHEIRFYARHESPIDVADDGITHIDTAGGKAESIAAMVLALDSDVIIVSSWKSLTRALISADPHQLIVLCIRANKDLKAFETTSKTADVSAFVVVSAALGSALVEHGYSREKIYVIENGYSPEVFVPHFGSREPSYVYAGAMVAEKGIGLLIEAFREIARTDDARHLHLYGSSRLYGQTTEYQFTQATLENTHIHIHGLCRQHELAQAFRQAELGFLLTDPSAGFEAFGKTALEMQACGLPVVVSSNGGLPERIVDGETGYILRDYTAEELSRIARLHSAKSDEERFIMSRAAFDHSKRFTWELTANRLHDLVCSLYVSRLHVREHLKPSCGSES